MQDLPAILQYAASRGRMDDTGLAHVTQGDLVVPRDIVLSDPAILDRVRQRFAEEGGDYRTHWVGSGYESINPETGMPEHGFLGGLFKSIGKIAKPILGGVLGSAAGPLGILGNSLLGGGQKEEQVSAPAGPQNAAISRPNEASLPSTLSSFSELDPFQRGTGLATQGAFGGGLGKDEENYFMNLLQRRLIDDRGNYADMGMVNPVEKTYLEGNMGLKFDGSTRSLLQALANRQAGIG